MAIPAKLREEADAPAFEAALIGHALPSANNVSKTFGVKVSMPKSAPKVHSAHKHGKSRKRMTTRT
eukprot:1138733-Karenia_brevis.AAC.1